MKKRNPVNRFTASDTIENKRISVSARFTGDLADIWEELVSDLPINSSDLIKECVRTRALLAEVQRRKANGEEAEVLIKVEETEGVHLDLIDFLRLSELKTKPRMKRSA